MTEKRERTSLCESCPAAFFCWSGEEVRGRDCVLCSMLTLGIEGEDGVKKELGRIETACDKVVWEKVVCKDCRPGFESKVEGELHKILKTEKQP